MGFFDSLRKMLGKEEDKPAIEKIRLDNLDSKLNSISDKLSLNKKDIQDSLKIQVGIFKSNIQEKIRAFELVDVDSRKEEEKIKNIVKENAKYYRTHLDNFLSELDKLEALELDDYVKKLNLLANNFSKSSVSSYQKATILIGKELGEIKQVLNNFFKEINDIFVKFKELSLKIERVEKIRSFIDASRETKEFIGEVNGENDNLDSNREHIQNVLKNIEFETATIKASNEYKKSIEEKEKLINLREELEEELAKIKEEINLRDLAKLYHYDSKKRNIINRYTEDFKSAILEGNNSEFVLLVKNAKGIEPDFSRIKNDILSLKELPVLAVDLRIKDLEQKAVNIKAEFSNLDIEIDKNNKKKAKLIEKIEEIKSSIENESKNLGFEILEPSE